MLRASGTPRALVLSAALAVVLSVLALATPGPAAAEPEVQVTFPEVTRFNPTLTDYAVQVDGALPEGTRLYAQVGGALFQELVVPGATRLDLGNHGATRVQVLACPAARNCAVPGCRDWCTLVATSPQLEVYSAMHVRLPAQDEYDDTVGPRTPKRVSGSVLPVTETGASTSWAVVASPSPTAPALSSGAVDPAATWSYHLPETIADGSYWLRLSAHSSSPEFGELDGVAYAPISVDTTAPRGTMRSSYDTVYPFHDWYRDQVTMSLTSNEPVAALGYEIRDRAGRVVLRDAETPWVGDPLYQEDDYYDFRRDLEEDWDGLVGTRLRPGTYDFRVVGVDRAENEAVGPPVRIAVSDHRIRSLVWKRAFSAARTVIRRDVGRCSQVRRPATRGWKGSIGYLSQTRCRRPQDSVAATMNGVYLPKVLGRGGPNVGYKSLRLSLVGGGVAGRRTPYLVVSTLKAAGTAATRAQFGPALGRHDLVERRVPRLVHDAATRPYLLWATGLTDGARYDVKSFTLTVGYVGLGPPRR